ncbi:MAG: hypothetical protein ACPGVG_18210 [Mycobacterium sp.]
MASSLTERVEFLREEFNTVRDARDAATPGTQAYAAMCRQVRQIRDELDAAIAEANPASRLSGQAIVEKAREYARHLPEAVLVMFADEWALRHRLKWVPIDTVVSTEET